MHDLNHLKQNKTTELAINICDFSKYLTCMESGNHFLEIEEMIEIEMERGRKRERERGGGIERGNKRMYFSSETKD